MDPSSILTWTAVASSALMLIQATQARPRQRAWAAVALVVGGGALLAWWLAPEWGGYLGGALWGLLMVVPSVLMRRTRVAANRQDYARAARLMKLVGVFHPTAELRVAHAQLDALRLAQAGQLGEAEARLAPLARQRTPLGLQARFELLRLQARWDDLVSLGRSEIARPGFSLLLGVHFLRALGECGERDELVATFRKLAPLWGRVGGEVLRDVARLHLFAFTGQVDTVAGLLAGRMPTMTRGNADFWISTALLARGDVEQARSKLEPHRESGDASVRRAVSARLGSSRLATLVGPDEAALIAEEARALELDLRHGALPIGTRRRIPVVATLTAVICLAFGVQLLRGASQSALGLFELGALWPPSVFVEAAWWRLITFQFLHAGALHLALNLFGLWVLGRDVEPRLGTLRTLIVYLASGTAGGLMLLLLTAYAGRPPQLLVGASGGIMGLAGAAAAFSLRALQQHNSPVLRRQLFLSIVVVALQTTFDMVTPQISAIAHLSGVFTGFVVTWLLFPRVSV